MQEVEAKRRHIRFSFAGVAEVKSEEDALSRTGAILDLSREGCLIVLQDPPGLTPSTRVTVTFKLNGQHFQLAGVVRSQRQNTRLGIRFDSIDVKLGGQLATLTASRTTGRAGRNDPVPATLPSESNAPVADTTIGDPGSSDVQTDS